MEENCIPSIKRPGLRRLFALLSLLLVLSCSLAQTTNIITLCTEEALQTYVGIGGIYRVGDCGTNVTTLNIPLTKPLVVERDFTLIATQEVLLNAQALSRLFVVKPGVHLTLQKILLFSGRHTETNFNDGGIADTAGAAIYNDRGFVTVLDGRFEANVVIGVTGFPGGDGPGASGESGGDAAGGAIYNNGGQIVISNTVFAGNTVTGGVGGKGGNGRGGSGGDGGNGGNGGSAAGAAIFSRGGTVTLLASTFTTNSAIGSLAGAAGAGTGMLGMPGIAGEAGDGVGAAVSGDNAELVISGCTFVSNTARGANGLAGNAGLRNHEGDRGFNGGDAAGAAIYSTGQLRVTNSTFFANVAISGNGGAGGAGGATGFGGNGGVGGDGGSATGAAIENAGTGIVVNSTFSDNLLTAGTGGAAGAAGGLGKVGRVGETGFSSGGAIYSRVSELAIANNILANSKITVGGTISDRGGNLSTDLNPLLPNSSTLRLTNPYLRPLAANGGPTQTMAIATNSPAIDAGRPEFCPPVDQRGSNRLGRCDIGAFEVISAQTNQPLPQIPTNVLNGLTIARGTNLITLQWPTGYTNLFLQFSTNLLSSNAVWSLAPQTATTNNGSNTVTISTTSTNRPRTFFRLYGLTNLVTTNATSGPPSP